jgi:hypothetical protein
MPIINFPTDPSSVNNEYSVNGKTWVYDATIPAWIPQPVPFATEDEMTTGTEAAARVMSPLRVKQAVAALADAEVNTANVTAAGALMDSEVTNLAAVKAFDPDDYATAAQGTDARTPTAHTHPLADLTGVTPAAIGASAASHTHAVDETWLEKLTQNVLFEDFTLFTIAHQVAGGGVQLNSPWRNLYCSVAAGDAVTLWYSNGGVWPVRLSRVGSTNTAFDWSLPIYTSLVWAPNAGDANYRCGFKLGATRGVYYNMALTTKSVGAFYVGTSLYYAVHDGTTEYRSAAQTHVQNRVDQIIIKSYGDGNVDFIRNGVTEWQTANGPTGLGAPNDHATNLLVGSNSSATYRYLNVRGIGYYLPPL